MRIGLVYPGKDPVSPTAWSGTPAGLRNGLEDNGVDVVPIPCNVPFPRRVHAAVLSRRNGRRGHVAHAAQPQVNARTAALSRAITSADRVDGLIAMGTDLYDLSQLPIASTPVVTYDDGTLAQFARHDSSELSVAGYPASMVSEWAARQQAACRRADACCVSSQWAAKSVVDDYLVEPPRVHVVGMGHSPRGESANRDWETPHFLFVGVDWERKNGAAVLRAFAQVRRNVPNASLHLVGKHPVVSGNGVYGHGVLRRDDPRAQAQLAELFARATVFVLPSRFEPFGIAYLEAASAGVPLIATTEGGAGDILSEGSIVVDPENESDLVGAMMRLCQPSRASHLGRRAQEIASHYSWQSVARRIVNVLEGVAPSGRMHITA